MDEHTPPEICMFPENYLYLIQSFQPCEENNFNIIFRINVTNKEEALEWLKQYEEKSKYTWRIQRTYKKLAKSNLFQSDFRCQHKTDSRHRKMNSKLIKNTDCPATIKIIIKRYFQAQGSKPPTLETIEYPCIVNLSSLHNHDCNDSFLLRFRDMSEVAKDKLLHYFQTGHGATSAQKALLTQLMIKQPENYDLISVDSAIVPSISIVQHLYNKTFSKPQEKKNIITNLKELIDEYISTTEGKAAFKEIDSHIVVALCTPIMLRTIEYLPKVNNITIVDVSSNKMKTSHKIYFFTSTAIVGGAPIGCILTDGEEPILFKTGIKLLKTLFPKNYANGPEIFIINSNWRETSHLQDMWPDTKILLCHMHVLNAIWRWIINKEHKIPKEERLALYFISKSIIYAKTESDIMKNMKTLQSSDVNEGFKNYILNQLWPKRNLWALCYRSDLPFSQYTNDYIEASFHLLKNALLEKVRNCNLVQLTDYILTDYEIYLNKHYLDFSDDNAECRYSKTLLKKFLMEYSFEAVSLIPEQFIKFDEEKNGYHVEDDSEMYFVDVTNCFCSCYPGSGSLLCNHMASVICLQDLNTDLKFWYSDDAKQIIYKIATGKNSVENVSTLMEIDTNTLEPLDFCSINSCKESDLCQDSNETEEMCEDDVQKIKQEFSDWCKRIYRGLDNNPKDFIPAVKNMLSNSMKHASKESDLLYALQDFATFKKNGNSKPSEQINAEMAIDITDVENQSEPSSIVTEIATIIPECDPNFLNNEEDPCITTLLVYQS